MSLSDPEPGPMASIHPAVWGMVIQDMKERDQSGLAKYKTRLHPFNGRDALIDAYQEALDLVVYLRQAIYERDHPQAGLANNNIWCGSCNGRGCPVCDGQGYIDNPSDRVRRLHEDLAALQASKRQKPVRKCPICQDPDCQDPGGKH